MEKITIAKDKATIIKKTLGDGVKGSPAFRNVYYNEWHMYASNGKTAVKINVSNNTSCAGLKNKTSYEVISFTKESKKNMMIILVPSEIRYPAIEDIFVSSTPAPIAENEITIDLSSDQDISITIINLFKTTGNAFDYALLKQFASIPRWTALSVGGVDKPLSMVADDVQALILPFKL